MRNRLKSALKTFNHREKGSALPIVLIVLLLGGLLILPLMSLISTSMVAGETYEANSQGVYAADAGVMEASWFIQTLEKPNKGVIDPVYLENEDYFGPEGSGIYEGSLTEKINGLTVSYKIEYDGAGFLITSTATDTDGSTTTIETRVHYPPVEPPIMVAAGALDGTLVLGASAIVGLEGDDINVYANGDIQLVGGGEVWGDAYYTPGEVGDEHNVFVDGGSILHGSAIPTTQMQPQDGFLPDNPLWSGYIYPETDPILEGEVTLGNVYIFGDLTVGGKTHLTLTDTVWVQGKIIIEGQAIVDGTDADGDLCFMISESYARNLSDPDSNAITIKGTSDVTAIMYAMNGGIYVAGTASLDGAAIGADCQVLGSCILTSPLPFEPVRPPYRPLVKEYWKII